MTQSQPSEAHEGATAGMRFERLDALRGAAVLWMVAFHFSFDLNLYGLLQPHQQFLSDPFWTVQRSCIVSLFLVCAGLGQAIATAAAPELQPRSRVRFGARFWRRWWQIAACAALVSAGSAWMFPRSWISFGVLHGVAVMLVLARLAAPLGRLLWPLGALALWLPQALAAPFFDSRWSNWVGLVTNKPVTEDWVPVLPWLGVMLWGLAAGQWLVRQRRPLLAGPLPGLLRPLAWLGQWSLSVYMVHQPVLIGAILAGRSTGWW